ncbi:MAG: hypothetical protein ACFFAU_16255 [Candidatus Hodarchaeota archaeon]
MTINTINIQITINAETEENAMIIRSSIDPDNLADPPMTYYSKSVKKKMLVTIKNVKKMETALSSVIDLLSAIQTIKDVLELKNINN